MSLLLVYFKRERGLCLVAANIANGFEKKEEEKEKKKRSGAHQVENKHATSLRSDKY